MDGETSETLRLYVTRTIKYNKYSCTATEEGLESERSGPVQIDHDNTKIKYHIYNNKNNRLTYIFFPCNLIILIINLNLIEGI